MADIIRHPRSSQSLDNLGTIEFEVSLSFYGMNATLIHAGLTWSMLSHSRFNLGDTMGGKFQLNIIDTNSDMHHSRDVSV